MIGGAHRNDRRAAFQRSGARGYLSLTAIARVVMDIREHAGFLHAGIAGQNLARQPLAGQNALVTGANSGIGRAVALALADAGASVVVNYVAGENEAHEVADLIEAGGGRAV